MTRFLRAALLLVLLTLLVVVNPSVALIGALVLGGCYSVIYLFVRRYMSRAGEERVLRYTQRHRLTTEALGGIKTLKLQGREAFYRDEFSMVAHRIAVGKTHRSTRGHDQYAGHKLASDLLYFRTLQGLGGLLGLWPTRRAAKPAEAAA